MRIEIAEPTCSNNEIKRKYRQHHAYARERNRWHYLVREQSGPPQGNAIDCCEVTVTRYGKQLLDPDNFGGGLKFLFDALVSNGVLVDDNPRIIKRLHLEQYIDRKHPRTVVDIIAA